jgi:hypothetical protein
MSSRPALLVLLGLAPLALEGLAMAAEKPTLLVVSPAAQLPQESKLLAATLAALGKSDRYRLLPLNGLLPLMREADEREAVRKRAAALVEEGRQLLVSLDHQKAKLKLDAALETLERGFVRYYDPLPLANVHLLLGQWATEQARPDLANREFEEALLLDPALTVDAHYSPQVRAAFAQAKQRSLPRPGPSTSELRKLLKLAGSPAAVVLGVEPAGQHALVRGAVFAVAKGAFAGVDSRLVEIADNAAVERGTSALGVELRAAAEPLFSAPPPATRSLIGDHKNGKVQPPPPRKKPWYRRWYVWTAAGAVVAGTLGVVLPLTIRREVVEGTARW